MLRSIILMLCGLFVLTGCYSRYDSYNANLEKISKENNILYTQLLETKKLTTLKRDKFTNKEWRNVITTISTANLFMTKYKIIGESNSSEINVADVDFLWQLSTTAFYKAKSVVISKEDSLNLISQDVINSFVRTVDESNDTLAHLLSKPSEEGINDSLVLILGILNNATKMLNIVALAI